VNECLRFDCGDRASVPPPCSGVRYDARAMPDRPRKSSTRITLVLLGAAALAGACNAPDSGPRRAQYATREDCLADWGDPQECEEQLVTQGDGSRRRVYIGGGSGRGWGGGGYWGGSSTSGSHVGGGTTRGGFGSSGHAHGSSAS